MNNIMLIINCFLYVFSLTEYLIGIKYINNEYNYKNFWFINLLNIILIPCYLILLKKENIKKYLLKENLKILLYPIITGILYTIESIFLYYAIDNLPLGFYIILRSSFIIFNIPLFKFLIKKKISNIYICSCILLILSYILIIKDYTDTDNKNDVIKYITAIFFCSLINSIYNNLIEFSIKNNNLLSIIEYQIIFQFTYFIIIFIPSIYYTVLNSPPINIKTFFIYTLISIGLQMYMYNKIFILNNNNSFLSSNILLGGFDLLRRIILLLFAFLFFNEKLNIYVNLSLVFFSISSLLLIYEYFKKNDINNHIELEEEKVEI